MIVILISASPPELNSSLVLSGEWIAVHPVLSSCIKMRKITLLDYELFLYILQI